MEIFSPKARKFQLSAGTLIKNIKKESNKKKRKSIRERVGEYELGVLGGWGYLIKRETRSQITMMLN